MMMNHFLDRFLTKCVFYRLTVIYRQLSADCLQKVIDSRSDLRHGRRRPRCSLVWLCRCVSGRVLVYHDAEILQVSLSLQQTVSSYCAKGRWKESRVSLLFIMGHRRWHQVSLLLHFLFKLACAQFSFEQRYTLWLIYLAVDIPPPPPFINAGENLEEWVYCKLFCRLLEFAMHFDFGDSISKVGCSISAKSSNWEIEHNRLGWGSFLSSLYRFVNALSERKGEERWRLIGSDKYLSPLFFYHFLSVNREWKGKFAQWRVEHRTTSRVQRIKFGLFVMFEWWEHDNHLELTPSDPQYGRVKNS